MNDRSIPHELEHRIKVDVAHYHGSLPERVAIAWRGYLAALLEWSVISISAHDRLRGMLPEIENDPVTDIMLGRCEGPSQPSNGET
jgi:hypothetical protein